MINLQIIENKSIIKISGKDAVSFLQGILTIDIEKLEGSAYSLMLSPQGRYISDFFILKVEDYFLVEIPNFNKDQILQRLRMYKLRSEVEMLDVSDEFFVVFSDKEIAGHVHSYSDPRVKYFGLRSIFRKEDYDVLLSKNSSYYNQMKYSSGVLDGSDLIYEKSIPILYGMHKLNAINFEKGCYVGQEVISRSYHTGVIRKAVYIISSEEDIKAQKDDEILINGVKIGKILSAWQNWALGLINNPEEGNYNNSFAIIAEKKVKLLLPKWS